MKIKQSVLNTLNRVGISIPKDWEKQEKVEVFNRFGGGSCETYPFIKELINWVYETSNAYEMGLGMNKEGVRLDDFDRIRYFILEVDQQAYMTCID